VIKFSPTWKDLGQKVLARTFFKALYTSADILVNKEISEGTNFLSFLGIPERF